MIKAGTNYIFTQGVVLDAENFFKKGFVFKTEKNGSLEEGKFNASFPQDVLEIWLENGVIENQGAFKPKQGDICYYINSLGYAEASSAVSSFTFSPGTNSHPLLVAKGNVFKTLEDVKNYLEQVRELGRQFYSQ